MITVEHTRVGSVQTAGDARLWTPDMVYVGMPGRPADAYGITEIGPFGKPWAFLKDPRGWAVAYREYLHARLLDDQAFCEQVRALHGKTLLCWCLAKAQRRSDFDETRFACHALILARATEWLAHK